MGRRAAADPVDAPPPAVRRSTRLRDAVRAEASPAVVAEPKNEEMPRDTTRSERALIRKKNTAAINGRANRAKTERLYLVGRRDSEAEFQGGAGQLVYIVLGTTGNVYYASLGAGTRRTSCTCLDQRTRKRFCKHLLFVLLRVLKVPESTALFSRQEALLTEQDMHTIYRRVVKESVASDKVVAPAIVRQAFTLATGILLDSGAVAGSMPTVSVDVNDEEDCAICYEQMVPGDVLVRCETSCRKCVHKECWERWASSKVKQGQEVTCVYCRQVWADPAGPAKGQPFKKARVNLEQFLP